MGSKSIISLQFQRWTIGYWALPHQLISAMLFVHPNGNETLEIEGNMIKFITTHHKIHNNLIA